ncbi:S1C family serine protease [Streptomyces sp. SCSIO ZS0520]|uniref:S1C family serine protease n=1 Tax=Streptomyces sp. SCSIO ZS0520 TaxID=2892996 RepID=UPI0021DA12C2|nr:trypsin-like peptidase domain-containing protein [Streptomyces sp. SCSIO ZS0520]
MGPRTPADPPRTPGTPGPRAGRPPRPRPRPAARRTPPPTAPPRPPRRTPAPPAPRPPAQSPAAHAQGAPDPHQGGHPAPGQGGAAGGWPPPPPPPAVPSYAGGAGGGGHHWGSDYHPHQQQPKRRRGGLIAGVLAGALLMGAVGGGVGYLIADNKDDDGGTNSSTTVSADSQAGLKRSPTSVAGIAGRALPSVVTIEASGGGGQGDTGGTGFVYDQEGHILTNNHVVATAAEGGKLSATFSNGKKYAAEVIGRAQGYDVAVIKLKNAPGDLKPLALGNSDKVAVGDSTIAIGAPFGLNNTVTTGIVSAKDRPVASSDGGSSNPSYMSALQTDASINPGNSGGPLLDSRGAVIGINSAIQSGDQGGGGIGGGQPGSVGLGFAIPINQARTVASQLMKTGEPVYPVIGASVSLQEQGAGAKITEKGEGGAEPVTPGGPADKAGLKPGDVITKLDDTVIDSGPTLIGEIWTHKPGDTVKLTYERGGQEHTVDVTLGQRKGDDD